MNSLEHERIWLSPPHIGSLEQEFVAEAFATNWISPAGPHIQAFEQELGQELGDVFVAALSSGTAAIHLALVLLGIDQGDEVICSTFTFSGTCNPILYQRATPVFIDSEVDTWNMDPKLLKIAIEERIQKGKKPKAIIVVHLYGMPARMREINALAAQYEIPIIEDAAEALGSSYEGKKCGSFGHFGILSFNGNKIITTSGGGALVAHDKNLVERAKFLATQARDPAPHYEHSEVGYNYRLSNVCAGIGRGQLRVLADRVTKKRELFSRYSVELSTLGGISFQPELPQNYSNRWLTCAVFDDYPIGTSEKLRLALEKESIESRPLWKPMHLQPVFSKYPVYESGVSERLFNLGLCLPSGTALSVAQQERVFSILQQNLN